MTYDPSGTGWGQGMGGGFGGPSGYGYWGGPYSYWGGPYTGPFYGPWGGTYAGTGFSGGINASDQDIENMVLDNIDADPAVPYNLNIEIDVTGSIVTLTGTVPTKYVKHALGDDAWSVPAVIDVNNQLTISGRRQRRAQGATGSQKGQQG